jgi:hypothetical protein
LKTAATALAIGACLAVSSASAALIDLTPAGGNGTVSATAILLADLIANPADSIVVGDKIFTGFGYSGTGDMPTASLVNVLGLRDSAGNWGLRFQGSFLDLPGGGNSDAHISFMVEVSPQADPVTPIIDAHLSISGTGVAGDESAFIVDETLSNGTTLEAFVTTIGPGAQQNKLTDAKTFAPVTKLNVVKDILAIAAAGSSLPSRGTVIDQSFSQVPEPSSVALVGLSSLALAGIRRRRE